MDVLYGFRGLTFLRYYSLTLFILATQPSKILSFPGEHIGALLHFHCVYFFPVLPCLFDMSVGVFIYRATA